MAIGLPTNLWRAEMRRRDFIAGLGGAAAWPVVARAQQPDRMRRVGVLIQPLESDPEAQAYIAAFRLELGRLGWLDGRNVRIDVRWDAGTGDQAAVNAAQLVSLKPDVILVGGPSVVQAVQSANPNIPIVFASVTDPVRVGFVESLSRPGGNVTGHRPGQNATGISVLGPKLGSKRLALLNEGVSKGAALGILVNPAFSETAEQVKDAQEAARALGRPMEVLQASTDSEIDEAFARLASLRIAALLVGGDPLYDTRVKKLAALTARHMMPAIFQFREYAAAGGLMSYGVDLADAYRQVGAYAGRILKGEKPADLPVVQPTKFEFVINLRTAKALGFQIPADVLALADEVIE
jgi:putative ABC transport system substrate-binding protein